MANAVRISRDETRRMIAEIVNDQKGSSSNAGTARPPEEQPLPHNANPSFENTTEAAPTPPISNDESRRKPLPWPEKFAGERQKYPAWEAAMLHKLSRDSNFIGNHQDKFYAVHERLEGTAQKTGIPFYTQGGPRKDYDPIEYIRYLRGHFFDSNRSKKASQELRALKQLPNQRFANFYSIWEQTLAEAGGTL